MTREEFMNTTIRLQELYNRRLNDTQLQFWFNELKFYEVEKYKRAVGEYVKANSKFPNISDILYKLKNLKPLGNEKNQEEIKPVECETCKGSGLVKYNLEGYEYLCRCYCDNSKRYLDYPFRDYKDVFYYRRPVNNDAKTVDFDVSQINF